jgi:putative tryptophan/tyrosine transport system substrate-binding protein
VKRRELLCGIVGLVVAPPTGAQPANRPHRVGFVASTSPLAEISGPDPDNPFTRAFVHGLRDLGYVQGRNLRLEMRTLEGKPERLEAVVAELVRLRTDVIFLPTGNFVERAQKVAPNMPIVALFVASNLVTAGVVQSRARPGGMVTGVSIDVDEQLEAKRLELLREFAPQATRIAYLGLRQEWDSPHLLKMRAGAERLGLTIVHLETGPADFKSAFSRLMHEGVHAYMVERSPRAYGRRQEIGRLALASGLPGSCGASELVEEGCLMSYSNSITEQGRRIAGYVDRILKGAKPGDLAIEAPTKIELVINARAANALGIAIPQSLRLRADRVIE